MIAVLILAPILAAYGAIAAWLPMTAALILIGRSPQRPLWRCLLCLLAALVVLLSLANPMLGWGAFPSFKTGWLWPTGGATLAVAGLFVVTSTSLRKLLQVGLVLSIGIALVQVVPFQQRVAPVPVAVASFFIWLLALRFGSTISESRIVRWTLAIITIGFLALQTHDVRDGSQPWCKPQDHRTTVRCWMGLYSPRSR